MSAAFDTRPVPKVAMGAKVDGPPPDRRIAADRG